MSLDKCIKEKKFHQYFKKEKPYSSPFSSTMRMSDARRRYRPPSMGPQTFYRVGGMLSKTVELYDLTELLNDYFDESNLAGIVHDYLGSPFIMTWRVYKQNSTLVLPLDEKTGSFDFICEWGDGSNSHITTSNQISAGHHTFTEPGEYTIHLTGKIDGFTFDHSKSGPQIIDISQWGLGLGLGGKRYRLLKAQHGEPLTMSATDTENSPLTATWVSDHLSYQLLVSIC